MRKIRIFRFNVHPGTKSEYLQFIKETIKTRKKATIFYHNLHTIFLYYRDSSLREYFKKALVIIDGRPIIKLLGLYKHAYGQEHRITYQYFVWDLLQLADEKRYNVYVLGNTNEVIRLATDKIKSEYNNLSIIGHHGYFDSSTSENIIHEINEFSTDILLVGMGIPKQEKWIYAVSYTHLTLPTKA